MLASMTGFATHAQAAHDYAWSWDVRGVNAKGLDVRLRLPDWVDGLEQAIKAQINQHIARGNVTIGLRITRDEGDGALSINEAHLAKVLETLRDLEGRAQAQGITVAPITALDLMSARGVMDAAQATQDTGPLKAALVADFEVVLSDFITMRAAEGSALEQVLAAQLDTIETLTTKAAQAADARRPQVAETLKTNLVRVLDNTDGVDEDRLAQELAMLAVKADVTEEIDRLGAHIGAARDLIGQGSPIGRKLDFLMQEFNREANTLCAKSQDTALTGIGLDLKATIDQMREQVQNVE
ncbi:MAG: YicC/YloC family endoribonuclease [Pseudomonadota bacterium]